MADTDKTSGFEFLMTFVNTDGTEYKVLFDSLTDAMREANKLLRSLRVQSVTINKRVA